LPDSPEEKGQEVAVSRRWLPPIAVVAALLVSLTCISNAVGAEQPAPVSFGVMADVQYVDQDARGKRHYREALGKLEECVAELNTRDLAFTIQLGDLTDRHAASLDRILPVFNQLRMPKYHVLGNHDFSMGREEVLAKLGMGDAYYSFSQGNWRFVVLDTMDVSTHGGWPEESENYQQAQQWEEELRSEPEPHACNKCGGIGEQQKRWLRATLREACEHGEKVIVFGHIPVVASPGNEWALLHNHAEVQEILESSECVVAYFNGHAHEGGYAYWNGVHYVNVAGMVEAPEQNAYAGVNLYDDRVEIRGVGKVPSHLLQVRQGRATGPSSESAKTAAPLEILKVPFSLRPNTP